MPDPTASRENHPFVGALNTTGAWLAFVPVFVSLLLTDHAGTVDLADYFRSVSLSFVLFFLPDHLSRLWSERRPSPYNTPLLCTVYLLTALTIIGSVLPAVIATLLIPLLLLTTLFFNYRTRNNGPERGRLTDVLIFLATVLFCYLLVYGQGYHNFLFTEAVAQRAMHIDILFHSSIAESIQSLGTPSSSIDGSPYFHYHWLSHLLMGSLAKLTGVSSLAFYNLFYPAIFVPLFLKSLYQVTHRLALRMNQATPSAPALLLLVVALFAIPFSMYRVAQPFVGESLTLSLLLMYTHLDAILRFTRSDPAFKPGPGFALFSLVFLTAIAFTKISTGFVWIGTMAFLCFWRLPWQRTALFFPGFLLIAFLVLHYVFPEGRESFELIIFTRLRNLLEVLGGAAFLFFPLLILLVFLLATRPAVQPLRGWWKDAGVSETIIVGFALVWGLGLAGALLTSSRRSDVMVFMITGIVLGYPLLLILCANLWRGPGQRFRPLLYLLIGVLALTHLRLWFSVRKTQQLYSGKAQTEEQTIRTALITDLHQLREENIRDAAIYIPAGSDWFYETADSVNLKSPMAVPAISGLPMVGGIPEVALTRGPVNIYGLGNYVRNGMRLPPADLEEAKTRARDERHQRLIIYTEEQGKLVRSIEKLR